MKDWLRTFGAPTTDLVHHPTGYAITSGQESLVVSILSAGTFFGALLGAPMADIVGRKWGIIFSCLIFSVGVAMQTAATAMGLFVVGRVVAGLGMYLVPPSRQLPNNLRPTGVGLVSVLVPMYQSEW